MSEKVRSMISSAVKAFLYGCVLAVAVGVIVFLIGFVAGDGLSWTRGITWTRNVLYVAGSIALLIGCGNMYPNERKARKRAAGMKDEDDDEDPEAYHLPQSFERIPGISWAAAVVWGGLASFIVATIIDYAVYALL